MSDERTISIEELMDVPINASQSVPNIAETADEASFPDKYPDDAPDEASNQAPATDKPKRRKRIGFFTVLVIIFILLLAAIGGGAVYFWGYINDFEASRLEHVIEHLQENIDYEFWEQHAEGALLSRLSEFESGGASPLQPHLDKIRGVRYIYRQKSDENTPETPVFILRAGALDIGIVRFIATQSIGHGFSLWEVGSVEFLESFVDTFSRRIVITASQNALVTVNGVEVSDKYLVDCEYEHGATYSIDGIYGDVGISVYEFDGTESEIAHEENGWYFYPITIPFSREYNMVIPQDCLILVDGEPVSSDKITDSGIIPDIFSGIVDQSEIPSYMYRYEFSFDGLYVEPVVSAVDVQGRDLLLKSADNSGLVYIEDFSPEYRETHTPTVESFIRAYVNFAANVGGNIGGNVSNLNNYVLRNSELYRRIQATRAAMVWVGGITVIYNELKIDNFRPYGNGFFSCEVFYNITNRTSYGNRELEGCFEVLFQLSGGRWLAINMVAI